MDLLRIVQEFEEGYEVKYNRRPKLVKKLVEEASVCTRHGFIGSELRVVSLTCPPVSDRLGRRRRQAGAGSGQAAGGRAAEKSLPSTSRVRMRVQGADDEG